MLFSGFLMYDKVWMDFKDVFIWIDKKEVCL